MFSRLISWVKNLFKKEQTINRPDPIVDLTPIAGSDPVDQGDYTLTSRQERLLGLWDTMERGYLSGQTSSTIDWYLIKAGAGVEAYKKVEAETGVPWQVVACVHGLECSFSWSDNLMNGQPYTQKTTWVPKGYGPWNSWHDAAVDAFVLKKNQGVLPTQWHIGATLEFLLKFNGLGYEYKGLVSPYLWSFTNHYKNQGGGKYVSDGEFSSSAISKQVGAAVLLKELNYQA